MNDHAQRTPDFRPSLELIEQLERFREQLGPIIEGSQQISEQLRRTVQLHLPPDFRFPTWEEQEQAYRLRLKMLADHGWYAAAEFPLVTLNRADALFREGRQAEANAALTEWFDRQAQEIIRQVIDEFPETSELMTRALRAHQEQDYIVSVMVLLAQAEGIWGRHSNLSPYSKAPKKKQALQDAINAHTVHLPIRAYWELLLEDQLPIKRNFDPADTSPLYLSRHAVMHGASLNFGTKINSARALSWLSYVAEIRGFFALVERQGVTDSIPPAPSP